MLSLNKLAKRFVIFAAIVALLAMTPLGKDAWVIFRALSSENACGLQIAEERISPDQRLKAVMFQFDCGATTPFTTQVSVLEAKDQVPHKPGNVFSAYHGSREGPWHGPYAEIEWLDASTLGVRFVADAKVTRQSPMYETVKIKYVALPVSAANQALQPTSLPPLGRQSRG